MRAAGVAAARIAAPIVARRGGGVLARLKAEWSAVAGPDFAGAAWPEALARDGALKLRVEPSLALDVQHRVPLLIERINRFFGHAAVARIILLQATLSGPALRAPSEPAAEGEAVAIDAGLENIADPELRAALSGLGRLIGQKDRED
jgi:hypothetical protein